MRKILPGVIIAIVFLVAVEKIQFTAPQKRSQISHQSIVSQTSQSASRYIPHPQIAFAQEKPVLSPPVQLTIPKIGLHATIVPVGVDSQNRMDVPNNFVDVGWYDLGSKPGEIGSAVLDGHYDDFHGHPAVFYSLSNLVKGDQVVVTDSSGKQRIFIVTDTEVYPVDDMPLQQIFHANDTARLNIITCHPPWDTTINYYSQRLVVYSTLQGS